MPLKSLNYLVPMLGLALILLVLFFSGFLELSSATSSIPLVKDSKPSSGSSSFDDLKGKEPFTNLLGAFRKWDLKVGCGQFKEKNKGWSANGSSLQDVNGALDCGMMNMAHVSILVKGWTWIPDNLDNLYLCRCGLSCLWTKSSVLADKPDALLYENVMPPSQRRRGDPLRVYMDLEASRKPTGFEDIFIGYHANDDVQSTYAGARFHDTRNPHLSSVKNNDTLVYWSSSRCLPHRDQVAKKLLSLLTHHSFGKCLNNVGGPDMALDLYPECANNAHSVPNWWDHLHCAMSHYKFVLAIENTQIESYVTEKVFYALDAGAVPIYFGAPNVWDFVPPNSIIDGSKFSSLEELAKYVKALANDPVAYAEYHAWRRCGMLGNYGRTRAASLDTLPCRLCEVVSRKNGRNARTL
ncbi:fucosyltransferase 13 [Tasmannia lanceolata]|uniref:fucosyltransferase 13 n=1 Tax=Tasmannia lanceolata TaxID=3420 RepID=UPI0040647082